MPYPHFSRLAVVVLLAFCSIGLRAQAPVSDVTDPAIVEAFVDGAVKPAMQEHHSPSGVVAVMKGGEVILVKGYGHQNLEQGIPVDGEQTMFRPGSISKLFTWIAVMQLVEQGRLDLDVDVNTYLKTFEVADTWPGKPVTLRHIMTHTAGFEDGALGFLIVDDVARIKPLAESLAYYQPKRVFPPGKRVAYSNWGTALAGLIVANVSGQAYNDYVKANIFDVLGMEHATFAEPLPESLEPYMARAYRFRAGQYEETPYEIISNFGPAGAAAVSASAMLRFARALLNGGELEGRRILQAETLQQMLDQGFVHDERVRGVGLGFLKYQYGPTGFNSFGHDGATSRFFSHFGVSSSEDFMLFSSFSGPEGGAVNRKFVKAFYDEFFPVPVPALEPPTDFAERASRYAGVYNSSRANFSTLESVLRALGGMKVVPMPDNTLLVGEKRYIEVEPLLFREQYGSGRIAFQEAADGAIDGFVMDGFGVFQMYRVPFYETADVTLLLVGLIVLVAALSFIRIGYQWRAIRGGPADERRVEYVTLAFAVCTVAFFGLVGLGLSSGLDTFYFAIAGTIKAALVFPLLLVPITLFHIYQSAQVWRQGLFAGYWPRVRHSLVSLVGLLAIWFYFYWNLIGFNYMT
ncbi:serine hydrolase domain-containing protein [Parahaliea aestuarii]|uniref:Serine hydrolase n=1 Tax=Parahaliea aestuarii TaxID=1852021 RepID=A0A5C8ZNR6_9GAMM|nr:serine hydrolase domain-containing protein [Parahaliea aestuarii]TXS89380.1 serine hydrolase [Parahaliea aestuarii]